MAISMLEVRHLRLVRAIVEEGGPTRAAARLHLTQSAVSHQLAELEGRLGVALFSRVRRQLKPTPAGARLVEAARELLAELERVERDLHRAGGEKRETLRLAVESFTSYHWLPPVISALASEHPLVDVRVVLESRREPVASLLRGTLDLAIVSSPVRDRELVVVPLGDDEWTVILPPQHQLTRRKFISAAELGRETLFAHDTPRSDVERLRDIAAAEHAPLPRVEKIPLTDALVEMVKAGLGLGLVSQWAVAPFVARGEIVTRRFTAAGLPERWVAVYRRDASHRLPLSRVAELVQQHAGMPESQKAKRGLSAGATRVRLTAGTNASSLRLPSRSRRGGV
jgi:LysR family transcriptional regulator for metE and metH